MKVLVTGGRDFADYELLRNVLTDIHITSPDGISMIIEGGATGADRLASQWAQKSGIHYARVSAAWDRHGPSAGPKRNAAMLLLEPDLVVAFPGGKGTADMVRKATDAGITVLRAKA